MLFRYALVTLSLLLQSVTTVYAAQSIPPLSADRTVMVVSGSGAGSAIDTMVRTFVGIAKFYTTQNFIVENRPGGSGLIASNLVLQAPADGYTVLTFSDSFTTNFHLRKDMDNPLDKYHYIGITMDTPLLIFTYRGSPYPNLKTLVSWAHAHPGQQTWGGPWVGSIKWVGTQRIWKLLGIKAKYVSFKDGATLDTAVMGKHVEVGIGDVGDLRGRGNLLVALAIAAAKRADTLPDVPTLREAGYDIVLPHFRGFVARKEIPDAAKKFYDELLKSVMADERWKAYLKKVNARPGGQTGAEMEAISKEASDAAAPFFASMEVAPKRK